MPFLSIAWRTDDCGLVCENVHPRQKVLRYRWISSEGRTKMACGNAHRLTPGAVSNCDLAEIADDATAAERELCTRKAELSVNIAVTAVAQRQCDLRKAEQNKFSDLKAAEQAWMDLETCKKTFDEEKAKLGRSLHAQASTLIDLPRNSAQRIPSKTKHGPAVGSATVAVRTVSGERPNSSRSKLASNARDKAGIDEKRLDAAQRPGNEGYFKKAVESGCELAEQCSALLDIRRTIRNAGGELIVEAWTGSKKKRPETWRIRFTENVSSPEITLLSDMKEEDPFLDHMITASLAAQPVWMHDSQVEKNDKTHVAIADTALRGISLDQFCHLASFIQDALDKYDVVDNNFQSPTHGQRLAWDTLTMYNVCTSFVLPLTQACNCSYVETVSSGEQAPQWMVSHWWGTSFAFTVRMLKYHAESRYGADAMKTFYWCCTLANNQHDLTELEETDIMKSPFARALMSRDCIGTVMLCDPDVTPLRRVWVVFEAYITGRLRDGTLGNKPWHFFDVMTVVPGCGDAGFAAALLQDATGGNWHDQSDTAGISFPLEVARNGVLTDIHKAEASVKSDRYAIMNFIATEQCSADPPPEDHPKYDELNELVHSIFASAELYRVASEQPKGCVAEMARLLKLRADPNKFVRAGNTALLAVVGADACALPHSEIADAAEQQFKMLELLLEARANPNHTNSSMITALDYISKQSGNCQNQASTLLKQHGAGHFQDVGPALEREVNAKLAVAVDSGFASHSTAFCGGAAGGTGAKLWSPAANSLQAVAAVLKLYPCAPCLVEVQVAQVRSGKDLAQKQAEARTRSIISVLQGAGSSNPFESSVVDRGVRPVRVTVSFKTWC